MYNSLNIVYTFITSRYIPLQSQYTPSARVYIHFKIANKTVTVILVVYIICLNCIYI